MGHERVVVADVVIRGEDGDGVHGGHRADAEQAVEDRGGGSTVLGLNDHAARRQVGQEGGVEAFVSAGDHHQGLVRRGHQRAPPAGLVQEGLPAEDPAELLGPLVPRDPSGQGKEACAFAPGDNQTPPPAHDLHFPKQIECAILLPANEDGRARGFPFLDARMGSAGSLP